MSQGPVAIRIGGQIYRVRARATEQELQRLAATVDSRLRLLSPSASTPSGPQALLLVAISLAHELETERAAHQKLRHKTKELLQLLLEQVDRTLATAEATLATAPTQPASTSDG
jgi:cell division protein ZapA